MEVNGVCSVCARAGVLYSCSLCGKPVCRDCITLRGVCKPCLGGRTMSLEELRGIRGFDTK